MKLYKIFIFIICILLLSCDKNSQNENIKNKLEEISGEPVIIGILAEESPKVIYEKLYPLKKFISQSIKRPVLIEIAKDFKDLENKIRENKVNLLIIDPATYCELKWSMKKQIFLS